MGGEGCQGQQGEDKGRFRTGRQCGANQGTADGKGRPAYEREASCKSSSEGGGSSWWCSQEVNLVRGDLLVKFHIHCSSQVHNQKCQLCPLKEPRPANLNYVTRKASLPLNIKIREFCFFAPFYCFLFSYP